MKLDVNFQRQTQRMQIASATMSAKLCMEDHIPRPNREVDKLYLAQHSQSLQ